MRYEPLTKRPRSVPLDWTASESADKSRHAAEPTYDFDVYAWSGFRAITDWRLRGWLRRFRFTARQEIRQARSGSRKI